VEIPGRVALTRRRFSLVTIVWAILLGRRNLERSPAAGDTGTQGDPYKVADRTDLEELAFCSGSYFAQTADITLASQWQPLPTFTGNYQGNGRTIDGLTNTSNTAIRTALIRVIDGGTISDVNLTGVNISSPDYYSAGALAGELTGGAIVSGVSAAGSVSGEFQVGGLVGYTVVVPGE